ncbi:hypothetical protein PHJA_000201700 [Phtheirospermum japonicum]|uniref:Uncharacterized protein n=1 Tax=Phtheirospermum japonicum TaxID=374723 RepID=A0A830B7W2_9LAMI|nr:hypothetical protein PHJA_000201700 [Phtheirospermum japonicum]
MGLKLAPSSLHWSQSSAPHSPSSSQTLASAFSSPRRSGDGGGALFCRYVSASLFLCGAHQSSKLYPSHSYCNKKNKNSGTGIMRRALAASLDDSFSDEEFSKQIQELTLRSQLSENDNDNENPNPFFRERDEIIPANIERKANSVDIPLSLRMIKRKKQEWQEGIGESARCSVKKAFSSMVFIIRELHSYTLQMRREILYYEDLQGILASVQKEMHASFVWLFQKVFSHTPTLMVHLMILLANYSVYSMSTNAALAATCPPVHTTEQVSVVEDFNDNIKNNNINININPSIVRTVKLSSSNGNTASVGGNSGGGGGKYKPVASGTEGDEPVNYDRTITPSSISTNSQEETLWDSIMGEASRMGGGSLDQETVRRFVSPVDARIESDDQTGHLKTELLYQTELDREPNNPLLLANYAQFLYLVAQDFDRAEEYFKRASKVEPKDAEALNKYANFLWAVRNDLWAAEETFLEAISTEPENSYYAASYAHFLWNTGGEDTCFPLGSPDDV